MLLHKPQVYRHILFNRLSSEPPSPQGKPSRRYGRLGRIGHGQLPWSIIKLCLLLLFFEVYIKWANLDHRFISMNIETATDFFHQYLYLFSISCLEFAVFQFLVRMSCLIFLDKRIVIPKFDAIIAGLIISGFGKLLHIVMVIWDYHDLEFSYLINMTVFTSNLETIAAIFNIPYYKALVIMGCALIGKYAFQLLVNHFDPAFPLTLF